MPDCVSINIYTAASDADQFEEFLESSRHDFALSQRQNEVDGKTVEFFSEQTAGGIVPVMGCPVSFIGTREGNNAGIEPLSFAYDAKSNVYHAVDRLENGKVAVEMDMSTGEPDPHSLDTFRQYFKMKNDILKSWGVDGEPLTRHLYDEQRYMVAGDDIGPQF